VSQGLVQVSQGLVHLKYPRNVPRRLVFGWIRKNKSGDIGRGIVAQRSLICSKTMRVEGELFFD